MNIENLFPLIVPSTYVSTSWNLPHEKLPISEFVLTWVEFEGSSPMTYLTESEFVELNNNFKNWQQQSFENLKNEGDYFHTHTKFRGNTDHVIYISFLNEDGIGSSRILLSTELSKGFTKGYYLALPDRSCGLIISKDITDKELEETKLHVDKMYKNATIPMSGNIYDPMQFALPNDWTQPIDKAFSDQIIDIIPKSS